MTPTDLKNFVELLPRYKKLDLGMQFQAGCMMGQMRDNKLTEDERFMALTTLADILEVKLERPVVQLPLHYIASELGNTWLTDDLNHAIWIGAGENQWLHIAITPNNYPGLTVAILSMPEAKIAAHINEKCQGWFVRKCNIQCVNLSEDGTQISDRED